MTYTLPDLSYDYSALAPTLSARAMELHHSVHHAKYVENANRLIDQVMSEPNPEPGLSRSLQFNLGGHVLHSLYWQCLSPSGGRRPEGRLAEAIDQCFGGFERFHERFTTAMTSGEGSGWAALARELASRQLLLVQLHDHHLDIAPGLELLLVADAWEHAHYLDYGADRAAWAGAFFDIVDWSTAAATLELCRSVVSRRLTSETIG